MTQNSRNSRKSRPAKFLPYTVCTYKRTYASSTMSQHSGAETKISLIHIECKQTSLLSSCSHVPHGALQTDSIYQLGS